MCFDSNDATNGFDFIELVCTQAGTREEHGQDRSLRLGSLSTQIIPFVLRALCVLHSCDSLIALSKKLWTHQLGGVADASVGR